MSRLAPCCSLGDFLLCPSLGTDLRVGPFGDETGLKNQTQEV